MNTEDTMNSGSPRDPVPSGKIHWEDYVVVSLLAVSVLGIVVALWLDQPPFIVSLPIATFVSTLVHRFLGGTAGNTVLVKGIKLTGGAAIFAVSTYYSNKVLDGQLHLTDPDPSEWTAIVRNTAEPTTVRIKGEEYPPSVAGHKPGDPIFRGEWRVISTNGALFAGTSQHTLAALSIDDIEKLGFVRQLLIGKQKDIKETGRLGLGRSTLPAPYADFIVEQAAAFQQAAPQQPAQQAQQATPASTSYPDDKACSAKTP